MRSMRENRPAGRQAMGKAAAFLLALLLAAPAAQAEAMAAMPVAGCPSTAALAEAEAEYSRLPARIRGAFEASGWAVRIVDGDALTMECLGPGAGAMYTAGLTDYGRRTVFISDRPGAAALAAVHEIGHWVDGGLAPSLIGHALSEEPGFLEAYRMEAAGAGMDPECTGLPVEYFAEAFRYFIEAPGALAARAPMTYALMASWIGAYCGG